MYSRNGQFAEDKSGNVVSSTGQALQVYPPLVNGGFNTGALSDLNLQTAQSAPLATTTGTVILNLPAGRAVPPCAPFNPTNSLDLQPVDFDHGVRLAGQCVSGDHVLHADRGAQCRWTCT